MNHELKVAVLLSKETVHQSQPTNPHSKEKEGSYLRNIKETLLMELKSSGSASGLSRPR